MRTFAWITVVVAMAGTAACGGGSTGVNEAADYVAVQGKLVTRDGSANALDGVVVRCPETGTADVTDHAGSFRVNVPPNGPFHLDFGDPMYTDGGLQHHGLGEHHDPVRDGAEVDGDGVTVYPVGPYEWCDVEVHLEDGEIIECHVRWGDGEWQAHEGEHRMERDPFCEELDAFAEVEISVEDGCLTVEIEVDGYSRPASLDIYFLSPEGTEAYIDAMEIDSEGSGHLEMSWCEGYPLPFDAASPDDLGGYRVVVYDEEGNVVFWGHLPHHYGEDAQRHHHGWEDEDDGRHHGGPGGRGPHHGP